MKKFTLIELLVVIAIIGILASMLLPSLSKARESVKATVCLNNQRTVSVAMVTYMSENNEFTPDDEENNSWYVQLAESYMEEVLNSAGAYKFLECPEGTPLTNRKWHTNVATNPYLVGREERTPISGVGANPTETMMLIDSYKTWRSNWPSRMNIDKLLAEGKPDIIARHLEKANVTYLDGSGRLRGISYFLERSSNSHTFWDPEK